MRSIARDKVTVVFDKTRKSKAKTVVNVGGAGSSKSHSVAQLIVAKALSEKGKVIGVCRKTFPSLRMTAMQMILDLLKKYGVYEKGSHHQTNHTYHFRNGSYIQFFSMGEDKEDKEKIKSANFNYIWMEEANQFTYDDYLILKMRLRNPTVEGEPNQLYITLNPVDEGCWVNQKLCLVPSGEVEVIHSTYKDNPFLDREYIQLLENLINEDMNYYRVYVLGEWGRLDNLIYTNWEVVDDMPSEYEAMCYGLDFGYSQPMALIKVAVNEQKFFLDECFYEVHKTNADLIEKLSHLERGDIYADSSEPDRIEEICKAGYVCYPAKKDVKLGIDLCKRQKLYVTKRSVGLIEELKGYQWKEDKDGHVLDEPVKYKDHACDAFRYGIFGIVERFGFATARPGRRKAWKRY